MAHFMTYVLPCLSKHSEKVLFKRFIGTPDAPAWESMTYETYLNDLKRATSYWHKTLSDKGIKPKEVVGIWLTGKEYHDLVHLYAVSWAGYIPEVFNLYISHQGPPVVRDLLNLSKSRVLLHDVQFDDLLQDFPFITIPVPELKELPAPGPLPELPDVKETDPAMIFHTSGTTSGRPKPVPETHKWVRSQAQVQWPALWQGNFTTQAVINNLGSLGSVGSATLVNYLSWSGQCMIQTSRADFDANELLAMVKEGLNAIFLYSSWFSRLLDIARSNKEVYDAIRGMAQICYTGSALNPEDEAWIVEHKIPVVVLYATTETALCMVSDLSDLASLPTMHVIPGTKSRFLPTTSVASDVELDEDSRQRLKGGKLYDFFVPEDADNCPHPSIRNRPDGHVTGDLFEEIKPGKYAFRGRSDDWIRVDRQFCDTKSIEDNILLTCADFVENCVVVGHYKKYLVLLAEPPKALYDTVDHEPLKKKIMELHEPFNNRLFMHERIQSTSQIVIAVPGSLPRTKEKGNIRRRATEEEYARVLEEIYAKLEAKAP